MKSFFILLMLLNLGIPILVFSQGADCSSAVPIAVNGACASGTISSTVNTVIGSPTCLGSNSFNREGWYSFTITTGPINTLITGIGNNRNILLQTFSGTCIALAPIGCANAVTTNGTQTESISLPALANGTYYIRVLNVGTNGTMTLTSLCVNTPPANDQCGGALPVICGGTYTASTVTSTLTNDPTGTCGTLVGAPGNWYVFSGTGDNITASLCGATHDTKINVYSGSCGTYTCVNGNDDFCSLQSQITFSSITGTNYYIFVNGHLGATGSYSLAITCAAPPPVPVNNECSAATVLVSNTTCVNTAGTISGANASTQTNGCFGTADDDVWYQFVATTTSHNVSISNVVGTTTDLYHSVYAGSCTTPGAALVCSDPDISTVTGLTIGNTYYVRVFTYTSTPAQTVTFNICVTGCSGLPLNDECTGASTLTMNTYGSCTSTSTGNVSCASASGTSLGACFGNPDDDIWYKFVATAGAHSITLTSGFDAYMQLFSGICGTLTSLQCSDPNTFTASGLTIGQTYCVRVFSYAAGAPSNGSITLCVAEPPICPANLGAGNVNIASLPYTGSSQTTCGAGNDINGSNAATCGSTSYFSDMDKVYIFTPTSSGQITISLNSTQSWTAATLYGGCPFSGTCIAYVQNSASGLKSFCASVFSGVTYYLVIDGFGTSGGCISTFTLSITAPSSGVANDLPCAAIPLTIGLPTSGDNGCTSGSGEPAGNPPCWTSGSKNTVWYSFVAPSPVINISTTLGTLTAGTQIALYSGACSALTLIGCNEDPLVGCASALTSNSLLDATGLVTGSTYYIRVDGENDNEGTFTITVSNGPSGSNSPVPGQDCSVILTACNSTMSIGNPGYSLTGNVCDFDGANDCTTGETNSVWYQINIANTGNFNFTLMPNDGTNNSCGTETDYDFLLWKASGSGITTSCAGITANSSTALLACNYDPYGVTGIAVGGNAPGAINNCFNAAFEPTVSVTSGDALYLCVQNFTGSTQGFTIDFSSSGAGVVSYAPPTTVYWTGGANTAWTNDINWGDCGITSSCTVSAIVTTASANQPIISGSENIWVKDLIINPGATMTLNAGAVLNVCGNLTNNGTLVCSPLATININNASINQNITGNFTGSNKLGNIVITKTGGTVLLNDDLDIAGNFTTSNSTSILNTSGKYIKLAGNFLNSFGNTTFSNTSPLGTLEFNGSVAQSYNQGTTQLDLNKVVVNNAGSGVNLLTNMNLNSTSGLLTLTNGKITTNLFEVNMANPSTTSVSSGSSTSFVLGNLRRSVLSLGSYDFPIGHVTKGFQKANINFTSATSIGNLLARFDTWPGLPPTQGGSECTVIYNQPSEDNGYWTFTANVNPSTGTYNMTLYPLNATNTGAMAGWTIIKDPSISSNTWSLNGTCVTSTATQVYRNGMSGFSVFGVAQSQTPLPIELLSFTGTKDGSTNLLEWSTATEINNNYFNIEHSKNGIDFNSFAVVNGSGNSTVVTNYYVRDEHPMENVTYYRLKQIDFDGRFSYSKVIGIENKLDQFRIDNLRPNPTNYDVDFDIYCPINGELKLQLLEYTGRLVLEERVLARQGKSSLHLKMRDFVNGIYNLKIIFNQSEYGLVKMIIKE